MSFGRETFEEVMVGDDHENFEDLYDKKWAMVDLVFTIALSLLFIFIAVTNRNEILRSQLDQFITMLLFIAHQLISYLFCFILSMLIYCVLTMCRNTQKAYKLGPLYGMIQTALEAFILLYCAGHGAYLLYGKRLVF